MKRHLPVLPSRTADGPELRRPGWQWVLIGAVVVFIAWVPLVAASGWITALAAGGGGTGRSGAGPPWQLMLGAVALSTALASGAGGAVVGRFGDGARAGHSVLASLTAVSTIWILAWTAGALEPWPVAVASSLGLSLIGAPSAWLAHTLFAARYRRVMEPPVPRDVDRGGGQH